MFRHFEFGGLPVLVRDNEACEQDATVPLVLFLHRSGERGSDGWNALRYGLPAVANRPEIARLRIVVPQCPLGDRWTEWMDSLASIVESFGSERAVVTGFSMGGHGAWTFALRHPERVLRVSPIAAPLPTGVSAEQLALALPAVPIWVMHSRDDERVPVSASDLAVTALSMNGRPPRYTRYEGLMHGATCTAQLAVHAVSLREPSD